MTTPLGSFRVRAERAEAEAFAAAIRLTEGERTRLPLTFPMRWLLQPQVRDALMSMVGDVDLVPVHESQSFVYERPLACDETYVLSLSAKRTPSPDRLVVDGTIDDLEGRRCAQIETVLRLFSTKGVSP